MQQGSTPPPRSPGEDVRALFDEGGVLVQLFEAAPLAWVLVEAGRIVYVNAGTEALFGYPRDELVGRAIEKLLPERQGSELRARRKDGAERIVEVKVSPVRIGARVLDLSIVSDVTDARRWERSLMTLQKNLEQRNAQLESFAFIASHDLQEPLRKIVSFGDRLTRLVGDALDPRARDSLDRMTGAARRMQDLLDDLLEFSRLARRSGPFVPIDLDALIDEIRSDLRPALERAGARLEAGSLGTIVGEPRQIRQLFEQLIDNALKYRREGVAPHVRITARREASEDGEDLLIVEIADQGLGFEPRHAERIFDIFTRLHPRGEYEGTGVGLAICREICHRHRGSITATGAPGVGSTFRIVLPAGRPQERAA